MGLLESCLSSAIMHYSALVVTTASLPTGGIKVGHVLSPLPFILFFHQVEGVPWESQSEGGELETAGKTRTRDVYSASVPSVIITVFHGHL